MDVDGNWMEPDAPDAKAKIAVGEIVDVKGIAFRVESLETDEFGKAVLNLVGLSREEARGARLQQMFAGRG